MKIEFKDLAIDTVSNADGYKLFILLDKEMKKGDVTYLSLKDAPPMSSSFLNSFLGELTEFWGIDKIRQNLKIINCTTTQAEAIRTYLDNISKNHSS